MSSDDPREPHDSALGEARLAPPTVEFLALLPEEVRPMQLATKYPRILNRIAGDWGAPQRLQPYLTSLVVDERGDRGGFPAPILEELLRLARYYDMVLNEKSSDPVDGRAVWDTVYYKG